MLARVRPLTRRGRGIFQIIQHSGRADLSPRREAKNVPQRPLSPWGEGRGEGAVR
jgi:hypothetical protein